MTDKKQKENIDKLIRSFLNSNMGSDSGSAEAIGRFKYWISHNPNQDQVEQVLNDIWNEEQTANDSLSNEKKREILNFMGIKSDVVPIKKSIPLGRLMIRVAAVVIPIIFIAGGYLFLTQEAVVSPQKQEDQIVRWVIPNGQNRNETLVDSTKVWANAGSSLSIDITDSQRIVSLSGEAFFSVKKDIDRPFVVQTEYITITVLGTEFNVEDYADQSTVVVSLEEGKITLEVVGGSEWTLTPGQQFVYNKASKTGVINDKNVEEFSQWRTGKLLCYDMTVPEILKAVERKFNYQFEIDPQIVFSGVHYKIEFLPTDSPEYIINLIQHIDQVFDYKIDNNRVVLTKR